MEEIKEGDYIRTIKGNICKVLRVREKHRFMTSSGHPSVTPERYFVDNNKQYSISKPYVKKHSKNIIDLIEEGDYVNGKEVKHIADFEGIKEPIRKVIFVDETHLIPGETAENEDIETIVTKEQFENMEYKVEEQ